METQITTTLLDKGVLGLLALLLLIAVIYLWRDGRSITSRYVQQIVELLKAQAEQARILSNSIHEVSAALERLAQNIDLQGNIRDAIEAIRAGGGTR